MDTARHSATKLLLVDDDPDYLEAMGELLELVGVTAVTAQSVMEAQAVLTSEEPDILLIDRLLGDDDGEAFARQIVGAVNGQLRVALLTGASISERKQADLVQSGIAVLVKPVDAKRLGEFLGC